MKKLAFLSFLLKNIGKKKENYVGKPAFYFFFINFLNFLLFFNLPEKNKHCLHWLFFFLLLLVFVNESTCILSTMCFMKAHTK